MRYFSSELPETAQNSAPGSKFIRPRKTVVWHRWRRC